MLGRRTKAILKQVAGRLHPAARATIRRVLVRPERAQRQLVSVVIPFYNVEEYFAECLASVVQQTYRRLQIILVDDGSQDASLAVARAYARRDPRIRIIRQANRGLGAARNTGIAAARGRYLCFVDSDDTLPLNALAVQVRTLETTGSDFVVGSLSRVSGGKARVMQWTSEVHAQTRLGITLDEYPDILRNVFAWNKLYDRAFFDREIRGFPEGIRYEDQEATARGYVTGRFDVLHDVVYHWRKREDGTSITQQKADPQDLAERLVVKHRTMEIIAEGASRATFGAWMAKAIGFDMRPYFHQVPRTDLEFWRQLRRGMLGLAERADDGIWRQVAVVDRIPALAVIADQRADVVTFLTRQEEYGSTYPGVLRDGVPGVRESYLNDLEIDVPPHLLAYAPQDVRAVARVTGWDFDGRALRLTGTAYLSNLPTEVNRTTIRVRAVASSGTTVDARTTVVPLPDLDLRANDSWNSHTHGGFEAVLPLDALSAAAKGTWTLEVITGFGPVERRTRRIERDLRGAAGVLPVQPVGSEGTWLLAGGAGDQITLRFRRTTGVPVRAAAVTDHRITVTLAEHDAGVGRVKASATKMRRRVKAGARREHPEQFALEFPPLAVTGRGDGEYAWRLTADVSGPAGDSAAPLVFAGDQQSLADFADSAGPLRLVSRPDGSLSVLQRAWIAVAADATIDGTELVVTGRLSGPPAASYTAALTNDSHRGQPAEILVGPSADRFETRLDLVDPALSRRAGYGVVLTMTDGEVRDERRLRVTAGLTARFPLDIGSERVAVTLTRRKGVGSLWVQLRRPYAADERGRLHQRLLHVAYQQSRDHLRDAVVFESFGGRSVSDSPLAICRELRDRGSALELFWTVTDLGQTVPEGTTPLLVHSRRWLQVLATSRFLVNNANFPFYFRKREGQVYVQTWHGTPLKRIGRDVPGTSLSLSYRQLMTREPGYWDYLLAQNDYSARILPAAFGYPGRVIAEGYPRNDDLALGDSAERRSRIRKALGVAEDQCAILYAPTWRDNVVTPTRAYSLVQYLDPAAVRAAFGRRATVLLRAHTNTAASADRIRTGVVNVTDHPDVNDLMLAADVLVTDYSSVMFDFCVTGKPMIFLAPDLDEYRDRTRGLYVDFEETVPGPVCATTGEVVAWLGDLDGLTARFRDRYATFRETYAPLDDGHASKRITDVIWGEW